MSQDCRRRPPAEGGAEAQLVALRRLVESARGEEGGAPPAVQRAIRHLCSHAEGTGDGASSARVLHALQTLVVFTSNLLKHPNDRRFHRINAQNANLVRLVEAPGASGLLQALGWARVGTFWEWQGARSSSDSPGSGDDAAAAPAGERESALPTEQELSDLSKARDALQRAVRERAADV